MPTMFSYKLIFQSSPSRDHYQSKNINYYTSYKLKLIKSLKSYYGNITMVLLKLLKNSVAHLKGM